MPPHKPSTIEDYFDVPTIVIESDEWNSGGILSDYAEGPDGVPSTNDGALVTPYNPAEEIRATLAQDPLYWLQNLPFPIYDDPYSLALSPDLESLTFSDSPGASSSSASALTTPESGQLGLGYEPWLSFDTFRGEPDSGSLSIRELDPLSFADSPAQSPLSPLSQYTQSPAYSPPISPTPPAISSEDPYPQPTQFNIDISTGDGLLLIPEFGDLESKTLFQNMMKQHSDSAFSQTVLPSLSGSPDNRFRLRPVSLHNDDLERMRPGSPSLAQRTVSSIREARRSTSPLSSPGPSNLAGLSSPMHTPDTRRMWRTVASPPSPHRRLSYRDSSERNVLRDETSSDSDDSVFSARQDSPYRLPASPLSSAGVGSKYNVDDVHMEDESPIPRTPLRYSFDYSLPTNRHSYHEESPNTVSPSNIFDTAQRPDSPPLSPTLGPSKPSAGKHGRHHSLQLSSSSKPYSAPSGRGTSVSPYSSPRRMDNSRSKRGIHHDDDELPKKGRPQPAIKGASVSSKLKSAGSSPSPSRSKAPPSASASTSQIIYTEKPARETSPEPESSEEEIDELVESDSEQHALKITLPPTSSKIPPTPEDKALNAGSVTRRSRSASKAAKTNTADKTDTKDAKQIRREVGSENIDRASERRRKGEKRHMCRFPECQKMFTTKQNRLIHQWKHTGEKPYRCACSYGSASRSDLMRHLNRKTAGSKCKALPVDQEYLSLLAATADD